MIERVVIFAFTGYLPPFALQRILSALADPTPESKLNAQFFAFLTFMAHLYFAQGDLFKGWHTRRCYERTRGQVSTPYVYTKERN